MRILIVDDEPVNRFLLVHLLQENGFTDCHEAESGEEGLRLAEKLVPDIVLLDVVMPGMSGHDVAPKLKALQRDTYLPIIFITAMDDEENLVQCLSVGGDDFVGKPFNKTILAAKLKAHARTRMLSKRAYQQNRELLFHQQHIEQEHAIVEHIFSNVLTINRSLAKFLDSQLAPASNFNGDMLLIERSPGAGLYVLLGDFTGHGLASAIGAIPVSRAFQTMSEKGIPVAEMAETLNKTLLDFLPDGMFFAAAIIEIGEDGCTLDIWNGGLPHLILFDINGNIKKRFESAHMALGILEPDEFESDTEHYEADLGDRLLGYTDGVIELCNEAGEMLTEEGLEAWISDMDEINTSQLMQKVEQFRADGEQDDDISMFIYAAQPLGLKKQIAALPSASFRLSIEVTHQNFGSANPVGEIIDLISGHAAFYGLRSNIFTVLSELYNNALEHGILKLDSQLKDSAEGFMAYFAQRETRIANLQQGWIRLNVTYDADAAQLVFTIKESGEGFDFDTWVSDADSEQCFGRGIALVKELTDSFVYLEQGTKAVATFSLVPHQ
ncbi:ATP-binding SpoIIE family protein phosphatase [Planctobacterium marinum]|uniref:ATP-binding SpoIIE family protein phosphatase n=1 Tax=Planctobacterium marinum TaxID=1631968 RepID=UPI001E307721|nr:fused response regulator/phosphatase [Planctobacterium marinum]MCC2604482.1 fused response regulator/phosphatase [Planctobacterium marinum]